MTLVVARIAGNHVSVVSDMRVTDEHDLRRGYPFAVLKAVTISATCCVAFAGPPDTGIDALRVAAAGDVSFDGVTARLVTFLQAPGRTADFLVVSSEPARIARIRAGHPLADHQASSWIGDIDAFEEFQRRMYALGPLSALEVPQRISNSAMAFMTLSAIIRSGTIPSVGETAIAIVSGEDRKLRYVSGFAVEPSTAEVVYSGNDVSSRILGPAEGGFAYTVLTPTEPGLGAIGLYFPQGRLGLLYHPIKDRNPLPYRDVDHDEFLSLVEGDHGVALSGFRIS